MIYLIPIIGLPLAMIIAIKIDIAYKEKKRKRVMKSMYDFWHDDQHYFYTLFCNVFKCCMNGNEYDLFASPHRQIANELYAVLLTFKIMKLWQNTLEL